MGNNANNKWFEKVPQGFLLLTVKEITEYRMFVLLLSHVVWSPAVLGPPSDVHNVQPGRQGFPQRVPVELKLVHPSVRSARSLHHRSVWPRSAAPATQTHETRCTEIGDGLCLD